MLDSPRRPSSTIRIFSSAEYCFRVARRMSFTTCSGDLFGVSDFCLISSPYGYDEPEILLYLIHRFCPMSADAGQSKNKPASHDARVRVEPISVFARKRGWWYIQVSREMERHRPCRRRRTASPAEPFVVASALC